LIFNEGGGKLFGGDFWGKKQKRFGNEEEEDNNEVM
jgi:hypothetical protein